MSSADGDGKCLPNGNNVTSWPPNTPNLSLVFFPVARSVKRVVSSVANLPIPIHSFNPVNIRQDHDS
jgi:hypothetical protein